MLTQALRQSAMNNTIYNAVYDNDTYTSLTSVFSEYMDNKTRTDAPDLLIDTCYERIANPPHELTSIMWRQAEIALRRTLWDTMPQDVWLETIKRMREYLMTFTYAAYWANQTAFTVSNQDLTGLRFALRSSSFFTRLQGWVHVELEGTAVDIELTKRSLLGKQQYKGDQLVFIGATLSTPKGKKIRDLFFPELVWPDGFTVHAQ